MKDQIKKTVRQAVEKLYPDVEVDFSVDYAPEITGADLATNVAMILAKKVGRKPMDIAEEITREIGKIREIEVEVALPGFINFKIQINPAEILQEVAARGDKYGGLISGHKNEKVLVEYFQPNIAKPLHIGHMRSAVIGDCLYRLEKLFSKTVESDTHMGDWGTQFGILLYGYKKWGDDSVIKKDPINELNQLFIRANAEIEAHPETKEQAKAEFVKLEQGDKENRRIWKQFVDWSLEKFSGIYELLDIHRHEHNWPESFYEDKMPAIVESLEQKGLLKESQGAKIVDLSEYSLGTAVVIKSDEGTTYLLRDLATFIYRKKQGFTKQLYVVDVRQKHAFEQLFKILELMGQWKLGEGEHIDYGFMSLPTGALSTRKGQIVALEDVVEEATNQAARIIAEKNSDLKDSKQVARDVAIGALKYFDLSHNRHSNIVFDWDRALDFSGNSGPYLMYTHARIKSILRKAEDKPKIKEPEYRHEREITLLKLLRKFPWETAASAGSATPSILADYLYKLVSEFNVYYQEVQILKEEDKMLRISRLALIAGIAQVLKNGLYLLGIKAPEEM